jgi:hypothetical protein
MRHVRETQGLVMNFRGAQGAPTTPKTVQRGVRQWPYLGLGPVDATSDRWRIERPARNFRARGVELTPPNALTCMTANRHPEATR